MTSGPFRVRKVRPGMYSADEDWPPDNLCFLAKGLSTADGATVPGRVSSLLVLAIVLLAGCHVSTDDIAKVDASLAVDRPVASDPRAAICATVDAGPTVPYNAIQTIFDENCVVCHTLGADLVLEDGLSWGNLVNHPAPAAESCGGTLVVPENPSESYLYQKLTNPSPCSGEQMPRGELAPNPLPACVIAIVEAWISGGAAGPAPNSGG